MAAGIGASGAPCSVRAVCSDRRPSLPWTFPESTGPTIPRRGKGAADRPPAALPQNRVLGPAARSSSEKGGPKAARSQNRVSSSGSVRRLVRGLVGRSFVGGGGRGDVDLDPVQQVVGHLQGLVVLGI